VAPSWLPWHRLRIRLPPRRFYSPMSFWPSCFDSSTICHAKGLLECCYACGASSRRVYELAGEGIRYPQQWLLEDCCEKRVSWVKFLIQLHVPAALATLIPIYIYLHRHSCRQTVFYLSAGSRGFCPIFSTFFFFSSAGALGSCLKASCILLSSPLP
jgi:hypothetical protein